MFWYYFYTKYENEVMRTKSKKMSNFVNIMKWSLQGALYFRIFLKMPAIFSTAPIVNSNEIGMCLNDSHVISFWQCKNIG